MSNRTSAEKAARRIAGRKHLPGPLSLHWTIEIIEAAIEEAGAEKQARTEELEEVLGCIPIEVMVACGPPYHVNFSVGAFQQLRAALAPVEKGGDNHELE